MMSAAEREPPDGRTGRRGSCRRYGDAPRRLVSSDTRRDRRKIERKPSLTLQPPKFAYGRAERPNFAAAQNAIRRFSNAAATGPETAGKEGPTAARLSSDTAVFRRNFECRRGEKDLSLPPAELQLEQLRGSVPQNGPGDSGGLILRQIAVLHLLGEDPAYDTAGHDAVPIGTLGNDEVPPKAKILFTGTISTA